MTGDAPLRVVRAADLDLAVLPGRRSGDPLAGTAADLSLRIVELEPGVGRHPHRHPASVEHVYVLAGAGRVWCEGTTTRLAAGDLVTISVGAAHATLPDEPMRLLCVFPHPDLDRNLEELPDRIV